MLWRSGRSLVGFLVLLSLLLPARGAWAEPWSFAVFSDHLALYDGYGTVLDQVRRLREGAPGAGMAPAMEFVSVCGDLRPAEKALEIFREKLGPEPPYYLPVRGNHEKKRDVAFILGEILPAYGDRVVHYGDRGLSYYIDVRNVRWIVLDQYEDFGIHLNRDRALEWLKTALSTGPEIEHIFVAYHQPSLPWIASLDDFWTLLLEHRDKVRAAFFGHVHVYSRRLFPSGENGIWAVNTGSSGQRHHSDGRWTVVRVMVDGGNLLFETYRTPEGTDRFKMEDSWRFPAR